MNHLIPSVILIVIVLINIAFFIKSTIAFRQDWPLISNAWRQMEPFEKRLFYMGLSFFIFIPALKEHPASEWYVAKIIIEILPALAGSFLVAGVIAFMRQVHELRRRP